MSLATRIGRPAGTAPLEKVAIRLLLVEDSTEDAKLVTRQLSRCANPVFATTLVRSLSEALAHAPRGEHDIVLLDLSLADSMGVSALHELVLAAPHTPIVVLTGADELSSAVHAIRHGAQDYLVKSDTNAGQLARSIRMAIERKAFEAELAKRANFDQLTGLVNRTLFCDRLLHALARARRNQTRVALLYADLDGFKAVNDTFGHAAGDEVLRLVAERLRCAVRECETIARLGGDEFTILLEPLHHALPAIRAAERLLAAFSAPLPIAGEDVRITLSIGLALFPEHAVDADALLCRADVAMFSAKRTGGNQVRVVEDQ